MAVCEHHALWEVVVMRDDEVQVRCLFCAAVQPHVIQTHVPRSLCHDGIIVWLPLQPVQVVSAAGMCSHDHNKVPCTWLALEVRLPRLWT